MTTLISTADLDSLSGVVGLSLGLIALASAVFGFYRFVRPRWRDARGKVTAALDSIVGRDEIRDSITHEVRVPALPGIGVRMAHQEQQMDLLTVTVAKLVDQQVHQQHMEKRVDRLEVDVAELKAATAERIVTRVESVAAYRAMEEAIKATPDVEGQATED